MYVKCIKYVFEINMTPRTLYGMHNSPSGIYRFLDLYDSIPFIQIVDSDIDIWMYATPFLFIQIAYLILDQRAVEVSVTLLQQSILDYFYLQCVIFPLILSHLLICFQLCRNPYFEYSSGFLLSHSHIQSAVILQSLYDNNHIHFCFVRLYVAHTC